MRALDSLLRAKHLSDACSFHLKHQGRKIAMNLTVQPNRSPVALTNPAAPASNLKWMWVAIGVLGASVLALGATLVLQQRAPSASETAAVHAAQLSPTPRTPESQIIDEKRPVALMQHAQPAMNSVASGAPSSNTGTSAGGQGLSAGWAPAQPVRAQAPVCQSCGRVESVQAVEQAAPATGVGAVAGGVLGAVVGNQVGKGNGRTAATLLGAVGGGYVGHKVEQRTRTHTVYEVSVRMDDGSVRHFQRAQPTAVGTPVVMQGKGFRVDQSVRDGRTAETTPQAQPGAVRVANTY